ncbi:hypothetical protein D3C77_253680 [compost metagenome]
MICALCKKEKEKLIESHLVPAAAYQHVRGMGELDNDSPIRINLGKRSAFQTDKQIKQPLLCGDCEDLFSKNGEKKMGGLWATKAGFPLLDLLAPAVLPSGEYGFKVYDSRLLDKRVVDAVFYFVVSIFWRAQVWDWGRDADAYRRALGETYEKKSRRFLLGECELENVLLWVDVNSSERVSSVIYFPYTKKFKGGLVHCFVLLGIKFSMFVGRSVARNISSIFDFHHVQVLFISSDHHRHPSFLRLGEAIRSKVVAKGKLANKRSK